MGQTRLTSRIWIIANTTAGRGTARGKLAALRSEFARGTLTEFRETKAPGDEETLAAEAVAAGAQTIVAVGGDGTCSRIANAILRLRSSCSLAVVAAGTGNDFAKTLGVDTLEIGHTTDLVARGRSTAIDVGYADGHYFLNSLGFGFDASVLEASNKIRFLKGDAVYIYAALRQLFGYRGIDVGVSGAPGVERDSMLMVTISNGRYLGGAFKIAPHASVVDGKLDACFFSDSNVIERVKLFAGAMRGTHIGMPSVTSVGVRELTLTFAANPSMEMDGELRVAHSRTIEIRCVPRALAVIAAPRAFS